MIYILSSVFCHSLKKIINIRGKAQDLLFLIDPHVLMLLNDFTPMFPSSCHTGLDHFWCHPLDIIDKPHFLEKVEGNGGEINSPSPFGSGVVPRESVMEVVVPFAQSQGSNCEIFCRSDVLVVGAVAKHVGSGIDEPGCIEGEAITKNHSHEVGIPQSLTPKVPRHQGGHHKAHQDDRRDVVLPLIKDDRVSQDVGHVHLSTDTIHIRVLLAQKPSHVGKEEPLLGIYGVGGGLGVLVVDTVVSGPYENGILIRHRVAQGQEDTKRKAGFICPVGPKSVHSSRDPE